ncbi:lipase family protein [Microbulbifer hainanensis]|uniref:lipase family protein n=1 Tax=Microbulbifer hainanensis TaxID=2735675 RepID=UPI0018674618|nr:lipase family protein [Microbulbifer hainanensis]
MLTPEYSARLADDIYLIKNPGTRELFLETYQNDFLVNEVKEINNDKRSAKIVGKTGALVFLKSEHTMGVAAYGINNFKGHAIVVLKGTASGYDALTDLNAGLKSFYTGGAVHQGFYYTFSSFLPQLTKFADNLPTEVHSIHCIGHSLGGALATLAADWLASRTGKTAKLYTFGSPRVGLDFFATACRKRLREENIFRTYHQHDPVPMVPTWPFIHVPDGGIGDFQIPSPNSMNPIQHHKMGNYVSSVAPNGTSLDWDTIRKYRPKSEMRKSIEAWLKSDSILSLSLNTARMASEALVWVLKKVGQLSGIALVITGGTAFTLLDRLAIFMHEAYQFSKEVSFWILRLIKRLAQLIGIKIKNDFNMTVAFIRAIFLRVHRAVSDLVMRAGRLID